MEHVILAIIDWIQEHSGIMNLVFAGVVATAAVAYAIFTWMLVKETSNLRRAQSDPHISVYLDLNEVSINLFDLVIKNDGGGPAYNILFRLEEDFHDKDGPVLEKRQFINQGFNYLGTGAERRTFLLSALEKHDSHQLANMLVSWESASGKTFSEKVVLDLNEFMGFSQIGGGSPLHQIAKRLKEIEKNISNMASGRKQMRVLTKDLAKDLDQYKKEEEERYQEMLERAKKRTQDGG